MSFPVGCRANALGVTCGARSALSGSAPSFYSALVERTTGYVTIGKLRARTTAELNQTTLALLAAAPLPVRTITADNGTEFHSGIEAQSGACFFFATSHHSGERGTSENTNGLIRQYLPKRTSMTSVSQDRCDIIPERLNTRPRKRLYYLTPAETCDLFRD